MEEQRNAGEHEVSGEGKALSQTCDKYLYRKKTVLSQPHYSLRHTNLGTGMYLKVGGT